MNRNPNRASSVLLLVALFFSIPAFAADGLHVSGPQLLSGTTPITLRGVAVGDPILARQGRPLSDYTRIAQGWHANVVRISIHPSVWKYQPHEKVLAALQREIDAALANGMYVILDWHTIGWPDAYYEPIQKDWSDDPPDLYNSSFALAKDFWDAASVKFGSDPRIIFELWNEPVRNEKEGDHETETPGWHELKPYFAEIERIIRTHSRNVLLVTGNAWAYDLRGIREDPLPGSNIAYCWHIYASTDDNDEAQWAAHLDDLQTIAPVFVTEWGFQEKTKEDFRGSVKSFGAKFVRDFLEGRRLNSTAWCWHPDWTPVMLEKDWKTPTSMGRFVKAYLTDPKSFGVQ